MKILTFLLGKEKYGVSIDNILTIEKNDLELTKIPKYPSYVKGVVNVRSNIVPVLDLRSLLDIPFEDFDDVIDNKESRLIIFNSNDMVIALLVDNADTILDITNDDIDKIESNFGEEIEIVKIKNDQTDEIEELIILLEIDSLIEDPNLISRLSY